MSPRLIDTRAPQPGVMTILSPLLPLLRACRHIVLGESRSVHWLDAIEAGQIRNRVADVTAEVNAICWSADEIRLLFAASDDLARMPLGAESTEPLRLLARHFPLAVSLAHVAQTADSQGYRLVLWNLPTEFSEVLMQAPTVGLLAKLAEATTLGIGLRDIDVLDNERHTLFAELLGQFGLCGAYGMLSARRQLGQNRELECILLFWDTHSSGPTRREAALVGALQPFVANAIERTRQFRELERTRSWRNEGEPSFLQTLPPRQRQVATLLARTGLSYAEIAAELGLATGTVRKHAEWAFRRLGVNRRFELTAMLLAESEPAVTPTEDGSSKRSWIRLTRDG